MKKSHNDSTPKLVGGIVLTGVALVAFYTLVLYPNDTDESTSFTTAASEQTTSSTLEDTDTEVNNVSASTSGSTATATDNSATNAEDAGTTHVDGTYSSATKSYSVPHGETNDITVKVTITDGTVANVDVDNSYNDHESASYIARFESGVSAAVKGKKLSTLSIGRIGGASLTTDAFKKALSSVITEAEV